MANKKTNVIMGGIIKHNNGIGFKITFQDQNTANKYKDMFRWILVHDGYPLIYNLGYYDTYKENGMVKK